MLCSEVFIARASNGYYGFVLIFLSSGTISVYLANSA